MDIREYQFKAERTINTNLNSREHISNLVIGANGEIGEVTDIIKKVLYHGHKMDTEELSKEIGDVMWYLTNIATFYGLSMNKILDENIKKLEERYPDGFSEIKSITRKEYK